MTKKAKERAKVFENYKRIKLLKYMKTIYKNPRIINDHSN